MYCSGRKIFEAHTFFLFEKTIEQYDEKYDEQYDEKKSSWTFIKRFLKKSDNNNRLFNSTWLL